MNTFMKAKPIWTVSKAGEKNVTCLFRVCLPAGVYVLRLTASNFYRLILNGGFFGYGPARAAHGYARIDEYNLRCEQESELICEVAGYRTNTFYALNEQPFLQAELLKNGAVFAYTGENGGFSCAIHRARLQKVVRFSYQRPFTESYDFTREAAPVSAEEVPACRLLPRRVSYPDYAIVNAVCEERGVFSCDGEKRPYVDRSMLLGELEIFPLSEVETNPAADIEGAVYRIEPNAKEEMTKGCYALYAFEHSETGFFRLEGVAAEESRILLLFDEVDLRQEEQAGEPRAVDFRRNDTYNLIEYRMKKGAFLYETFEPYTARFVKILVLSGAFKVTAVGLRQYVNPDCKGFQCTHKDKRIEEVLRAAVRTFSHNAVDILTDCPSRERAGWLCDSWFSAQAERLFTGKNAVEYNFLENIALSPALENVPQGMIPMCYPADFAQDNLYIPNWAMWFVVELGDYFNRTGDRELVGLARKKTEELFSYFKKFENSDGLLEDLEGWIFVEWSRANDADFVCGVNYPSNMLYAAALESAGKLYKNNELLAKAEKIRAVVREQAFNGDFFEDNAVRKNCALVRTGHTSETCQYYAFFTGVASRESHPALWKTLLCDFGPNRKAGVYESVFASNAFIGNYLRLIMLKKYGYTQRLEEESVDYFYKMAKKTGTLWEHDQVYGSLDHGFASYIAVLLLQ